MPPKRDPFFVSVHITLTKNLPNKPKSVALDTRKIKDGAGVSYEAVYVEAEVNLVRTGTFNQIEFREVAKFKITFFFVRNPDLMGAGVCRSWFRISNTKAPVEV